MYYNEVNIDELNNEELKSLVVSLRNDINDKYSQILHLKSHLAEVLNQDSGNCKKFCEIYNYEPAPSLIIDNDYKVLNVNNKFMDLFHIQKSQILSEDFRIFFDDEFVDEFIHSLEYISNQQDFTTKEFPLKINNKYIFAEIRIRVLRNYKHHNDCYLVTFENLSEIYQNLNLQNSISELKFKNIFRDAPLGICIISPEGNFLSVNKYFLKLIEYSESEIYTMKIQDLVFEGESDLNLYSKNDSKIYNQRLITKNGTHIWVEISNAQVKSSNNKLIYNINTILDISEKVIFRQQLTNIQKDFKKLFESLPIGAYQSEINGKVLAVNTFFAKMLGYDSIEDFKENYNENVHFSEEFTRDDFLKMLLQNNGLIGYEYDIIKKNGERISLRENCQIIRDEYNLPIILEGTIEEITQLKKYQNDLLEQNNFIQTILDTIPNTIYLFNYESKNIRFINNKIMKQLNLGLSENEDFGFEFIINHIHPEDIPQFGDNRSKLANKSFFTRDFRAKNDIGEYIWFSDVVTPIKYNSKNEIVEVLGVMVLIDDRKQNEKRLKESENLLRVLIDNPNDVILLIDLDGIIIEANSLAENVARLNKNEFLNKSFYSFISRKFHSDLESLIDSIRIYKKKVNQRFKYNRKIYDVLFVPIFDVNDDVKQIAIYGHNITDLTLKEMELVKLNNQKDKFFSIIAHDLRVPVNGLVGITNILHYELNTLQHSELKEMIDALHISSKSVAKLIENLLQWAVLQRNDLAFIPKVISIKEVIDSEIELYSNTLKRKSIKIINNYEEKDCSIFADSNMMHTILRNIISNAIKYSYRDSEIEIGIKEIENNIIEIYVRDFGIGMSLVELEKLFVLGTKNSSLGTENEKGTGMGLLLCKELVEKNQGHLYCDSIQGNGTNFRIRFKKVV